MVKRNTLIGGVIGIVIIAGGTYAAYRIWHGSGAAKPAGVFAQDTPGELRFPPGAPQLAFIQVQPVQSAPEPLLDPLNGRVVYNEDFTARVSSPIAGRVMKIAVEPGTPVASGATLAVLDAPEFAAAISDVSKADAEYRQKELAFQRARELHDAGVTARKDFEGAEADYQQAGAERTRARRRLANLSRRGGDEAADRFVVRAPIAGVVADRRINPGAEVRPDQPEPLFVITDPRHLWVMIDLPERYLGRVKPGQEVDVRVDAYPKQTFRGRVANVGVVLDPATRRVAVRCVIDNPDLLLKPEMFARVVPLASTETRLPHIPNSALVSQGLYTFVFVETQPGVFRKRQVTLGLQGRDESYIREGLAEDERVVVGGALLLNSELLGNQ